MTWDPYMMGNWKILEGDLTKEEIDCTVGLIIALHHTPLATCFVCVSFHACIGFGWMAVI